MSENKISGRFLKFVAAIAVIVTFTIFYKEDSFAASFTHVHTDACYESVKKTCTNHHIKDSVGHTTAHCFTCQAMRDFVQIIYWDVCDNYLEPKTDKAYIEYCTVCGAYRRNESKPKPGSHSYMGKDLVCGMTDSTSIANVSLSAGSAAPTNGSVTLKINISDTTSEFALADAPFNFGAGNTSDSSFEVTENGTYSASVTDAKGRTVTVSCTVSCIDKANPVIDSISKSTEEWTESGLTVTVEAHDEGLGLSDAAFSFNGGEFGSSNSFKVTSNGTVSVRVRDAAGNVSEGSINIANIGRDPKVVEAERKAAEKAAAEKAAAEKKAAEEKAAAEKAAKEKAAAEKAAAEKAAAEKAAAEKAAKEKAAADAAEKAIKDKTSKESAAKPGTSTKSSTKNGKTNTDKTADKDVLGSFRDTAASGAALVKGSFTRDESGKLIVVRDLTETEDENEINEHEEVIESVNDFDVDEDYELYEETDSDEIDESSILKASVGDYGIIAGILFLLAGTLILSQLSYVYVMQGGKKRIICRCHVTKSQNGLVAVVQKEKLTAHGKYLLYISPWKKGFGKKVPVSVMLEGEDTTIPTDEGVSFKY